MRLQSQLRGSAALGVLTIFVSAIALSACDSGPSALPARDHSASATASAGAASESAATSDRPAARAQQALADIPLVDGKPMWAANRKHTAQENADYQFGKNGADFAASDVEAYVKKAHAFVDHSPKGVQTMTRANGDRLIYDAKANVFAVASKDGAPRTLFKPKDGAAYWDKQKEREAQYANKSKKSDDQG